MELRIYRILSVIFHPVFIPFYILLLLFTFNFSAPLNLPLKAKLILAGIVFFTTVLVPLLMNALYLRMNVISSFRMNLREERIFPLLTQAVFFYLTYYMLKNNHIPLIFSLYMLGATFLTLSALIISIFYKISLHMIGLGGVFGFLTCLAIMFDLHLILAISLTILLSGIMGTARLKSDSHKTSEIYSGFLVGTFGMVLLFQFI